MSKISFAVFIICVNVSGCGNAPRANHTSISAPISAGIEEQALPIPGAYQADSYFHMLEGKRIAFAGNHTAMVGDLHLVDVLLGSGINLIKIFSPEHGFRGDAAYGEWVDSGIDPGSGLPVISLYSTQRRPTARQLEDIDIIVFDVQDVGVRFYTYISAMTYIMEEAARHHKQMIVLDRPNPIGHYMDGPLMQTRHTSFVGLHAVPVAHGMTIGEYALMVNGEGWLGEGLKCDLTVIPVANYDHKQSYTLPIPPSPNLPDMYSVYLYPSLCFFEGTDISIGRGTDKPFKVFGHPSLNPEIFTYNFTPESVAAAPNPPHLGKTCHGVNLSDTPLEELAARNKIDLSYLLKAYRNFPDSDSFFNSYFERLSGTDSLRNQIIDGLTEEQIRESWQDELQAFKKIRTKYLLYPDFNDDSLR